MRAKPNTLRVLMDVTLLILAMVLMVVHADEGQLEPPVDYVLEVSWPPELNVDVDVYIQNPDNQIAWYGGRDIGDVTIDRDDLGHHRDPGYANIEFVSFRGLQDGWYYISLRVYRNNADIKFDIISTFRNILEKSVHHYTTSSQDEKEEIPHLKLLVQDGKVVKVFTSDRRIVKR